MATSCMGETSVPEPPTSVVPQPLMRHSVPDAAAIAPSSITKRGSTNVRFAVDDTSLRFQTATSLLIAAELKFGWTLIASTWMLALWRP